MFSHGQLINTVAWLIERNPQTIDGQAMTEWREYEITNHVPNCSGYKLTKHPDDAGWKISPGESRIEVTQRVPGRAYQAVRDPERLLIEERAEALSAAGYCEQCVSPDGRHWSFDSGDRFGTDPVALLSTWEHQTLERMLKEL